MSDMTKGQSQTTECIIMSAISLVVIDDKPSRKLSEIYEPVHDKTNNLGFLPGLTQTGLCSHRSRLEA